MLTALSACALAVPLLQSENFSLLRNGVEQAKRLKKRRKEQKRETHLRINVYKIIFNLSQLLQLLCDAILKLHITRTSPPPPSTGEWQLVTLAG